MTIEGLGKKFQEARLARKLTLDEAARMTKIRPSRLAEIEADDFSQFPSLAYAKGFLLIYGKFLEVDVTPYLEAFEGSENMTVDGYSYLQESPAPKPVRTPIIRTAKKQASVWPLVVAVAVFAVGFSVMKLVMNLKRLEPNQDTLVGIPQRSAAQASIAPSAPAVAVVPSPQPAATKNKPPPAIVEASPAKIAEPEVRRAQAVPTNEATKTAAAETTPPPTQSTSENRVDIKPLKKTYLKVVVDNEATTPAFEHWVSPGDAPVEFHGQHIAVRVLDREAIQIKKNGKLITPEDTDITIQ
jgi:cytoskeletal protein RodZ